jgi:pimeloyl-ACP methyl ester carboxylesterase
MRIDGPRPGPTLFVLLHAYHLGPGAMAQLAARIRAEPGFRGEGEAHLHIPTLPLSLLSVANPAEIVNDLVDDIDRLLVEQRGRFTRIILIGHSYGALLARKLYVVACGETPDASFEAAIRCREGRPWAKQVERIVQLGGMNRGWRLNHHLSLSNLFFWPFGITAGEVTWTLRRQRPTISYIRRGAPFIVQLRIQWIRMRCRARSRGVGSAPCVQLLGSTDDMVSPDDNNDLISGKDFVFRDLPYSGHADVIQVQDVTPLPRPTPDGAATRGDARFAVVRDALLSPESALRQSAERADRQQGAEVDTGARHVVFVVHGARDKGYRILKLARRIDALARVQKPPTPVATLTPDDGYLPMLLFLLPKRRRKQVEWLMDQYAEALARYPNARFSFVGHGTGTYLLARALKCYPSCRFERAVLAGSVMNTRYPWADAVRRGQINRVLNYVAAADWTVALFPKVAEPLRAQDIGSAGHDGFRDAPGDAVRQIRYIRGGHRAALAEDNGDAIAAFVLTGDVIAPPPELLSDKRSPLVVAVGYLAPLVWMLVAVLIVAAFAGILQLGIGETARTLLAGALALVLWVALTRL